LTAFATGAQVYWLLAWGIWGAPTSPLQYVSICGSVALLVAGSLAKWAPRSTAFTTMGASVAMWCFYAPALIHTIRALPHGITLRSSLTDLLMTQIDSKCLLLPARTRALLSNLAVRLLQFTRAL